MSAASRPTRESLRRLSLNEDGFEVSGDTLVIYAGSIGDRIDHYTTTGFASRRSCSRTAPSRARLKLWPENPSGATAW
jgi:hypothetical protein